MNGMPALADFKSWKKRNSADFSLFDYLYANLETKNVSPDVFVAFVQMFWPDIIEHDGLFFLRESFNKAHALELKRQGFTGSQLEYWTNLVCLDGMIELPSTGRPDEFRGHTIYVATKLKEMWMDKLRRSCSGRTFQVDVIEDSDSGDVCITFYQGSSSVPGGDVRHIAGQQTRNQSPHQAEEKNPQSPHQAEEKNPQSPHQAEERARTKGATKS